jgi:hypothetical protein
MAKRRHGNPTGFWNNVAAGAASNSTAVEVPRGMENIAIFITTAGATTIQVQCANSGALSSEGILPDGTPSVWFPLEYLGTAVSKVFAGAGSACIIIPDFTPA